MTPLYLNPPPSPIPLVEELKAEVDQNLHLYLSVSPPAPPSNFFNTTFTNHQDQRVLLSADEQPKPHDHKVIKLIMNSHEGSSSDIQQASSSSSISVHESPMHEDHSAAAIHGGHKLTLGRKEEDGDHYESASDNNNDGSSVKWMSSKMRLMKKMMTNSSNCGGGGGGGEISAADHNMNSNKLPLKIRHKFHQYQMHDNSDETNNNNSFMSKSTINNNNNTTVRVCSDCNTTTTPLWRSGPRGPKSLCNACGIRQRKARRAMEAAAAAGNTGEAAVVATDNVTSTTTTAAAAASTGMKIKVHINKEKKGRVGQYKNKQSPQSQKKLICFKEFALSLSKNSSALQRVFPQDVEDAAILLMELSCGLIHT